MFAAGFRGHFKDWYISEGGHEGPLSFRPTNHPMPRPARDALRFNLDELNQFIKRQPPKKAEDAALVARAQDRARALLKEFGGHTPKVRIRTRKSR